MTKTNKALISLIMASIMMLSTLTAFGTDTLSSVADRSVDYALSGDQNLLWLLADIGIYEKTSEVLTEDQRAELLNGALLYAKESSSASEYSAAIISLAAMGYDASDITLDGQELDLVSKLTELVDSSDQSVTSIYTLPYVIIALNAKDNFMTDAQEQILLDMAVESKAAWLDATFGTDSISPMILALSPYYDEPEIKEAIDEGIATIKAAQQENGALYSDGFETYGAASTGLGIAALVSVGIDPNEVKTNGKSLVDGLMSYYDPHTGKFSPTDTSFATEQGFRGLLALTLVPEGSIYNFGTLSPLSATLSNINPNINIAEKISNVPTFTDMADSIYTDAVTELASRGVINGKGDGIFAPEDSITRAEFTAVVIRALGLTYDKQGRFDDVTEDDWFYSYVTVAAQYGIVMGVSDDSFNPHGNITKQDAAVMLSRIATLLGQDVELSTAATRNVLSAFTDYVTVADYAASPLAYCYTAGILDDFALEITPEQDASRALVADMLYNLLNNTGLLN